jgi:hypothetical protein
VSNIRARAVDRFERLRRQALASVDDSTADTPAPTGWCVSAIARIVTNDTSLLAPLQNLQSLLSTTGGLYRYPAESLHLSLLGCTQREPTPQDRHSPRVAAIVQAFERAALNVTAPTVHLGGLNLIGNQFFVEVLPDDTTWKDFRERLATELTRIGEQPMTHPDSEPVHLNIARIQGRRDAEALRLLLSEQRPALDVALEIADLELVITDFVVSPESLVQLHRRTLTAATTAAQKR